LESRRQDRTVLGMDMDMGCGIWDVDLAMDVLEFVDTDRVPTLSLSFL